MTVLSFAEAAEFLNCSATSLYRMQKRGSLEGTYFKVGNRTLFLQEKLIEWAQNGGENLQADKQS